MAQGLVLLLLGCAVLHISAFSTIYLNYVRPGFRPFLIVTGAVVFVLGVIGLVREWRRPVPPPWGLGLPQTAGPAHEPGARSTEGHDHSRGPLVAWLLCLPVFAIFVITPPPLGSFAAERDDEVPPPPVIGAAGYAPLKGTAPVEMPIGEFLDRALGDPKLSLTGKQVRLAGFVVPAERRDVWYLTRMRIDCCAADAIALKVAVRGAAMPPENTWVKVTGVWVPRKTDGPLVGTAAPELAALKVTRIPRPTQPYE